MFRFLFNNAPEESEDRGLSQQQFNEIQNSEITPIESQIGQQCAICLDTIQRNSHIVNLSCNHFFHKNCILRWYQSHSTCPLCRTSDDRTSQSEDTRSNTLRLPLNQLIMLSSIVVISFIYPNRLRQVTHWNLHTTIVELFQFIDKSCSVPNANVQIRNDDHVFKTTESYSHLNKTLIMLDITQQTEFIISFF